MSDGLVDLRGARPGSLPKGPETAGVCGWRPRMDVAGGTYATLLLWSAGAVFMSTPSVHASPPRSYFGFAALAPELQETDVRAVARIVGARFPTPGPSGEPAPGCAALSERTGPVYVALRAAGRKLADVWATESNWEQGIVCGIARVKRKITTDALSQADTVELCLTHSYRDVDLRIDHHLVTDVHRGVRGIVLRHGTQTVRYSPTEMLARTLSFRKVVDTFIGRHRLIDRQFENDDFQASVFEAHQLLVTLRPVVRVIPLFRGNQLVHPDEVTQRSTRELADQMARWLERQVRPDGRMIYKYWPSRGDESASNNLVRQFMATVCLGRLVAFYDEEALRRLADRSLLYNLTHFYRTARDVGYVEYGGKVKLGAAAMAALAIVGHPYRAKYAVFEEPLRRFVDDMWNEDGRFRTLYKPAERTGNENFYPGEALLLWAHLLGENLDATLLDRFMTSVRYYRKWHLENRNPAFIPWHTQAYYIVWRQTGDPFLADWIFELNDWLLPIQQWGDTAYEDTNGRFYHPGAPYGPPHASSTGVYLEGLIDAYRLARELGDTDRMDQYRRVIVRGLRSAMQLQFADDVDMFYVCQRDRVRGALRTTVYNNEIRIDNVQHVLMAVLKILDTFRPEDYKTTDTFERRR